MEQVRSIDDFETYEENSYPADRDMLMDISDWLDDFFERKLFRFLIIAVPLYFGAHLINYLVNK